MDTSTAAFFIILLYTGVITLYVVLIVKFWKASNAIIETKEHTKNIAFRDTARYLSEIRRGIISDEDQDQAKEIFDIKQH